MNVETRGNSSMMPNGSQLQLSHIHMNVETVISALLGHAVPVTGFGHASRITPGYAHPTWEAMVEAVESLEYPAKLIQSAFAVVKNQMQVKEARKVG